MTPISGMIWIRFYLTAVRFHCRTSKEKLVVRLGEHNWRAHTEPLPHKDYDVDEIIVHDGYDWSKVNFTAPYDIALLRLSEPAEIKKHIKTIDLPWESIHETFLGKKARFTGWGRLGDNKTQPSVLQRIDMDVIKGNFEDDDGDDVVTISATAGWCFKGLCEGDSGGPLTLTKDGKQVPVGVLSGGKTPCDGFRRGREVFARVTYFLDWIDEHTVS